MLGDPPRFSERCLGTRPHSVENVWGPSWFCGKDFLVMSGAVLRLALIQFFASSGMCFGSVGR